MNGWMRFAALWVGLASPAWAQTELSVEQLEFFEERIRPVLIEHCYECHNSADLAEGGLALDYRAALQAGADGRDVLGSSPKDSRLLLAIRHELDGLEMPQDGPKLSGQVIADFERWIAWGAPDPRTDMPSAEEIANVISWAAKLEQRKKWWSFQPLSTNAVPPTADPEWSQTIDRYVLQHMREKGLQPARDASREVLVRRLYFNLIGLPPTPEQVRAFVNDREPMAYERLVDQLLESEHFGERWARHWMDWIRYAESHGSEGDPKIDGAFHYRDYLIRALNADVPYDQLIREHIAGDLLHEARVNKELGINESLIGTAHWRMVFHGFAPTDALDEKVRFTDDALNTVSKAFMGLTVSCARCHDHKFDPISQADYYALYGILASTRPGRAVIDLPERTRQKESQLADLKAKIREQLVEHWLNELDSARESESGPSSASAFLGLLDSKLAEPDVPPEIYADRWKRFLDQQRELQEAWKRFSQRTHDHDWQLASAEQQAEWYRYGEGLAQAPSPAGVFSIANSGEKLLNGIYPAGCYSHLLSSKRPARLTSIDFPIKNDTRIWLQVVANGSAMSRYVVQNYPRNGTVFPVTEFKNEPSWRWQSYDLKYWEGDDAHIELTTANDAPLLVKNNPQSWFGLRRAIVTSDNAEPPRQYREYLEPLLALVKESTAGTQRDLEGLTLDCVREAIQAWGAGRCSDAQALLLDECTKRGLLVNHSKATTELAKLVEKYRTLEAQVVVPTRVPSLDEWQGVNHPLYERGDHRRPQQAVPRRFLEVLGGQAYRTSMSGRKELAADLADARNPLTARVIVNRLWHHLFGRGIVGTPDNFGRLGAQPTHPELLDHLAHTFTTTDAWSIKHMIRRIVLSKTWRQSSAPSRQALEQDPTNQYLSHFPVRRLEAEAIRDALLSVSGDLDRKQFGPSVDGKSTRRSIYVRVIRNSLDPFLTVFDAPVPFTAKGRRDVTNVPAQSLLLMNNSFVKKQAARFATQGSDSPIDERIVAMWQRALGRNPEDSELQAAGQFIRAFSERYDQMNHARQQLDAHLNSVNQQLDEYWSLARAKLNSAAEVRVEVKGQLRPIAEWNFDTVQDSAGENDLKMRGTARLEGGALVLDGQGWAETDLLQVTLGPKTLEAVVILESLDQRGGGVMTVQTADGVVFDSIVFGEMDPRHWLAGSNNFRRTESLGGVPEQAEGHAVHVMLCYDGRGEIRCYRDGKLYGRPYQTTIQKFDAESSRVLFGMRHGKGASGNRMLKGKLLEARLYDRVLSADEAQMAASQATGVETQELLLQQLNSSEISAVKRLLDQRVALAVQQAEGGSPDTKEQPWIDLAHSLFNLKEFIYVR